MAITIPGGVYKDAEGDGYHNANGEPVKAQDVAAALKLAKEEEERITREYAPLVSQDTQTLAEAMRALLTVAPTAPPSTTPKAT
jgi:hypothetical protein